MPKLGQSERLPAQLAFALVGVVTRAIRIGLLGGSFNPAHGGHRRISLFAREALGLDEVWWLVSPGNPLKPEEGSPPPQPEPREPARESPEERPAAAPPRRRRSPNRSPSPTPTDGSAASAVAAAERGWDEDHAAAAGPEAEVSRGPRTPPRSLPDLDLSETRHAHPPALSSFRPVL